MMMSWRKSLHKIIVTSLILGVTDFPLSSSNPTAPTSVQNQIMYEMSPSAPMSHVLFSSPPRNLDVAESSFYRDGATVHGLGTFSSPGLTGFMQTGRSNPFLRSMVVPQEDILQTAAQTYFIEPIQPTTTTKPRTFKRRKTRKPITEVFAENNKQKKKTAANDNASNEISQGNPVPFNPFRQIVNTSFGRKRPSDSKLGRSRTRPGTATDKQETKETGSLAAATTVVPSGKNSDTPNEGEPRTLSQRRRPQDIRPVRPTSSVSPLSNAQDNNDNQRGADGGGSGFLREIPKPRRFPPRPRPIRPQQQQQQRQEQSNSGNESNSAGAGGVTNTPALPPRPRNLSRRPRPTTTLASTDEITEITAAVTTYQTQPPQTPPATQAPQTSPPQPPQQQQSQPQQQQQQQKQEGRRARPGRPLGAGRFGPSRLTLTTTALPDPEDALPTLPPRSRKPSRPSIIVTQEESNPGSIESSRLPKTPDFQRTEPRPTRGNIAGFILRPKSTPTPSSENSNSGVQQNENEIPSRPANRRRKRPSTTTEPPKDSAPISPLTNYHHNQQFTGGIVHQRNPGNFRTPMPEIQSQNQNQNDAIPARRNPQILRARPQSPIPQFPINFPVTYQVQSEQPSIQPIRGQSEPIRNPTPEEQPVPGPTPSPAGPPSGINAAAFLRRPTGPSAPQPIHPQPIQQLQQALTGPNLVNSGLYNFPSQDNLGFYPGFDNVLGVSSNLKTVQQTPITNQLQGNQFSARTTKSDFEPEISDSDSEKAASSEKQADPSPAITPSPSSPSSAEVGSQDKGESTTTAPPKKLSPLERLQQNRQAAARRLLTPRKPTEKPAPPSPQTAAQNHSPGKVLRKSIIPPRMLRPRLKFGKSEEDKKEEVSSSAPIQENNESSGDSRNVENTSSGDANNESTSSSGETDVDINAVAINPKKTEEPVQTSSRKPTILEKAQARRRIPFPGKNTSSSLSKQQSGSGSEEEMMITPPTPPDHDPNAPPPTCEPGQRYSKFLKRCVTMYKPKGPGGQG